MQPGSRLGKQLSEAIALCERVGAPFALIGGLALASHGVIRATQDVDLLTDLSFAEQIDQELRQLGYTCLHRSQDVGNYARDDERIDLLYASRPIARRLLASADDRQTPMGQLRIVSAEGLIGFKLQALVNNPKRTQDVEDIRALLRANRDRLDMNEVAEYFQLFDREAQLDELLREID